jgi:hypothetical protein
VIIWDKIVTSKDTAWLQEKNEFVKYALIDQGHELRYARYVISLFVYHHGIFACVLEERKRCYHVLTRRIGICQSAETTLCHCG